MTDAFKNKLERLLDEGGADGMPADRLRSRLAATLSEGLDEEQAPPDTAMADPASLAAFLDGELTGAEREKMAAALARQPRLRADMESAAELVSAVSSSPSEVPKHLLARAQAQFAPPPPVTTEQSSPWRLSLAALFPRRRIALAAFAALAIAVAVPAGLIVSGRIGSGGGEDPELSSVNEPNADPAAVQRCKDKAKEAAKETAKSAKPAEKTANPAAKDPCDQLAPSKDGSAKK